MKWTPNKYKHILALTISLACYQTLGKITNSTLSIDKTKEKGKAKTKE